MEYVGSLIRKGRKRRYAEVMEEVVQECI